jgi:hypothetical protein
LAVVQRQAADDEPGDRTMSNVQMWILIWQKAIVYRQTA